MSGQLTYPNQALGSSLWESNETAMIPGHWLASNWALKNKEDFCAKKRAWDLESKSVSKRVLENSWETRAGLGHWWLHAWAYWIINKIIL